MEFKYSDAPTMTRSLHIALADASRVPSAEF
jgi:hypothetical protein